MAKPSLIVVPLDGSLPFLLEGNDWYQLVIDGAVYDRTGDHYVIDPCDKTVLDAPQEAGDDVEKYDWFDILTAEERKKRESEEPAVVGDLNGE